MLPEDMDVFLSFVTKRDPTVVALRDDDSSKVVPIKNPQSETRTMVLWNRRLIPALERKRIDRKGGTDYYRIDPELPALELSPSTHCVWESRPALLQGRIYSFSDSPIDEYKKWYGALSRWLPS